jgi:hypothetical protein
MDFRSILFACAVNTSEFLQAQLNKKKQKGPFGIWNKKESGHRGKN